VLERWPDQRILYMSAHSAEVLARHGLTALNVPFLAKPYTRGEVLAKVREALEKPQRKRILVVDDESSIRSALGKMLTIAGYEVILAADGAEATRLWRERGPHLVILDLFMPEKDGIETIVELLAYSPGIPIIAMSGGGASNRVDLLQDARLLGAVATIEKPFEKQDLMELVARSLVGAP
jgi:DNA-binding NtrC family response regulator